MGAKALEVTPLDSALAKVIRRYLDETGHTLRALSRSSGVLVSRLSRCVRAERPFQLGEVEKIAAAFDMSASAIVAEAEQLLTLQGGATKLLDATQSDYELVAKPLSPDTAAAVKYWDTLGEEPQ